jgi:tetratricopeptide (TPR) repeat protein
MTGFLRKLAVAISIILVSTYSFNAQTTADKELIEKYFRDGLESLRKLNYLDALIYFTRAYTRDPYSYYGELSYLYLGKSYALYSYAYRSRQGILASIGYLNQYPYHYKVPRFIHTQREFIADSYLLLQWYDNAKNIYANLYGETEKKEYLIKLGYASALSGSIENFRYLRELAQEGVPSDYLDIYYMTLAFYNFNIGRYKMTIDYLGKALNLNPYLREDPHVLYRLGVSHNKLGDWRRALLYLELAVKNDAFGVYEERALFYLALINLETNNFREAFLKAKKLFEEDRLFYRKLSQLLFSTFWYYDDFLNVYGNELGDYRKKLVQIGWLNVENLFGELPALGIYYLSLKGRKLTEEEKKFLRSKRLTLGEIVYENDIFYLDRYVKKVRKALTELDYTSREDSHYISEIFRINRHNYMKLFGDKSGKELLARALTYTGDDRAIEVIPLLEDPYLANFLKAQIFLIKNRPILAVNLLERALPGLKGEDRLEARLLMYFLREDRDELEDAVLMTDFGSRRFSPYGEIVLTKLADLCFEEKDYRCAIEYYKKVIEMGNKEGELYWWAVFRTAVAGELIESDETLKWVVNLAKEKDNIWSRVILTLWEG